MIEITKYNKLVEQLATAEKDLLKERGELAKLMAEKEISLKEVKNTKDKIDNLYIAATDAAAIGNDASAVIYRKQAKAEQEVLILQSANANAIEPIIIYAGAKITLAEAKVINLKIMISDQTNKIKGIKAMNR
jgi:hypothetical protein